MQETITFLGKETFVFEFKRTGDLVNKHVSGEKEHLYLNPREGAGNKHVSGKRSYLFI